MKLLRRPFGRLGWSLLSLLGLAALVLASGTTRAQEEEKVLNVYNWSDYIAEDTLKLGDLKEKLILGLQKEKPQDDLEEDTEAIDALKEESAILATVESLQAAARETKEHREEADAEDAAAAAAGAAETTGEE